MSILDSYPQFDPDQYLFWGNPAISYSNEDIGRDIDIVYDEESSWKYISFHREGYKIFCCSYDEPIHESMELHALNWLLGDIDNYPDHFTDHIVYAKKYRGQKL